LLFGIYAMPYFKEFLTGARRTVSARARTAGRRTFRRAGNPEGIKYSLQLLTAAMRAL